MARKKSKKVAAGKKAYGNLHELFILKLQSLYDIEQELVKVLPKLAKNATNDDLRAAFEDHLKETEDHVDRLEQAFELLDIEPGKERVEGIRGIAADGGWVMKHIRDEAARDAALIAAAQYAEHYEIAGYGTAREWAGVMGHVEVEELLAKTLEEEEASNQKLTELAQEINEKANDMEESSERRSAMRNLM